MNFLNTMNPFLKEAWEKAGFEKPTPIQEKSIPLIVESKDIVAESPTGTGKTLAFLLPLLNNIDPEVKQIQAVILSPTRELAMQIHQVIQTFTASSGIVSAAFIGGADIKRQLERLKKNPQIIVGSPGRINELIDMKKMKMHEVKSIVVDEVDQMVAQRLTFDVKIIIKATKKDRQLLFFSATISDDVKLIAKEMMTTPHFIQIDREASPEVDHIYFVCDQRDKIEVLRRIYKMDESMKALIFINKALDIDRFADKFRFKKIPIGILHSEANKKERAAAIQQFRSGKLSLLLATDIAARGMDIQGLTHVIHLDMPEKIEQYIHRSGRTGRMGAKGTVVSIVTPTEEKTLLKYGRELKVEMAKKELYKGEMIEGEERPSLTQKANAKKVVPKSKNGEKFSEKRSGEKERRTSGGKTSQGRDFDNRKNDSRSNDRNSTYRRDAGNRDSEYRATERKSDRRSGDRNYNEGSKNSNRYGEHRPSSRPPSEGRKSETWTSDLRPNDGRSVDGRAVGNRNNERGAHERRYSEGKETETWTTQKRPSERQSSGGRFGEVRTSGNRSSLNSSSNRNSDRNSQRPQSGKKRFDKKKPR